MPNIHRADADTQYAGALVCLLLTSQFTFFAEVMSRMRSWFVEFVADDAGQDLIEYALLGATIGLAGAVAFGVLRTMMGTTYTTWGDAVQSDALVVMPDPGR